MSKPAFVMPGEEGLPQSAEEAERMYKLPQGVIAGLKGAERSKAGDVSPKGAMGPMQFMPKTWEQYGKGRDPNDLPSALDASARYMLDLHSQYGDWGAARAHYNGGVAAGKAVAAGKPPPSAETRQYMVNSKKALPSFVMPGETPPEQKTALAKSPFVLPTGEVAKAVTDEKAATAKATAKAMAEGVIPAAAGFAAFGAGASAAAAIGLPLAAATGPFAPITEAVVTLAGGLSASMGASYGVAKMQDYALAHLPLPLLQQFGMDPATRQAEMAAHPYASMAGSAMASLPFARPGVVPMKTMATMMGLGASLEAGKEIATGEPLDPIKIAFSAASGAAMAKTTKLGAKLGGPTPVVKTVAPTPEPAAVAVTGPSAAAGTKPHIKLKSSPSQIGIIGADLYPSLEQLAPKREYVGQVQEALGPGWSQDALKYWNTIASKFPHGQPLPVSARIQPMVDDLSNNLYKLSQMRQGDKLLMRKNIESVPAMDVPLLRSEQLYHYMPDEAMDGQTMPADLARMKTQYLDPLDREIQRAYARVAKLDPQAVAGLDPHNPRVVKDTWLTKVARFGEDPMGVSGFGQRAGTLNERMMLGLEYPDGTRKVVQRNGNSFNGFGQKVNRITGRNENTGPVAMGRFDVGDTLQDLNGQNAKVVQATTAEIEAQTGKQYVKDPYANRLYTLAQLRAYEREHNFLERAMPYLEKYGAAIKKDKVMTAPHGFQTGLDHPVLGKYYFNDRFAEAFQDALKGNDLSTLSRLNNMSVGTMFWNPEGHLFNALDHYINSIGWDFLKPWKYGGLIQDMYKSYKDVSTLSPDYVKYVNSGMGLQYARVAGEDVIKTMMKGIEKKTWDQIAVDWGMHPQKMAGAIYDKSKHALWGGSDILMLSAYRHAASEKGLNILNTAVKNAVETINPNYRIPSRIGMDTLMRIPGMPEKFATVVSRGFSNVMQTRLFNTFGRYHFGQMRALGQVMHDVAFQQTGISKMSRGEALSHLAFVAFNLGVVYPFVWDTLAKGLSGNEDAYMRRAGAASIPYTVWHLLLGDQEALKLISEAYNLPPITKGLFEMGANRQLFNGQHIWEPGDTFESQYEDARNYTTGLLFQPAQIVQKFKKPGVNAREEFAKMLGVKVKPDYFTDDEMEKMAERARRHRLKKGYEE